MAAGLGVSGFFSATGVGLGASGLGSTGFAGAGAGVSGFLTSTAAGLGATGLPLASRLILPNIRGF